MIFLNKPDCWLLFLTCMILNARGNPSLTDLVASMTLAATFILSCRSPKRVMGRSDLEAPEHMALVTSICSVTVFMCLKISEVRRGLANGFTAHKYLYIYHNYFLIHSQWPKFSSFIQNISKISLGPGNTL